MSEQKKIQVHENDDIKVQFNPNVCEHAAECVKGLSEVFDIKKRPWIQIDNSSADQIAEVINRCPTGALSYTMKGKDQGEAVVASATEVTVVPNGPLRLTGGVVIKDMEGNVVHESPKASLCRCGLSQNKPFCDGAHKREGWKG